MAEPTVTSGGNAAAIAMGATRDPLRPSARRVVLLLVGASLCLSAFGLGFASGLLPIWWREHMRQAYLERAEVQDPRIDFASADWLETTLWTVPELPGADIPNYAGAAMWIALAIAPLVLVAVHIVITRFAAVLALRTDRRLDLGLGERPARALAAAVMVRVIVTRLAPACLMCGLVAGLFYLGNLQQNRLFFPRLSWLPMAGVAAAVAAVLVLDLFMSIGAVRKRLQRVAPLECRVCNGCGYSLCGLRPEAEACPECGRALLGNLTVVSMVLSPRVGGWMKRVALLLLAMVVLASAASLVYSPVSRELIGAWLSARGGPVTFGPALIASVQSPDGAVLKVSDGSSSAYFTARVRKGSIQQWSVRGRGIEPLPGGRMKRIEYFGPEMGMSVGKGFLTTPAQVPFLYPCDDGVFATWVSGTPRMPLSVTFARQTDLSKEDWAWLVEELPTLGDFDEPRGRRAEVTGSDSKDEE